MVGREEWEGERERGREEWEGGVGGREGGVGGRSGREGGREGGRSGREGGVRGRLGLLCQLSKEAHRRVGMSSPPQSVEPAMQ